MPATLATTRGDLMRTATWRLSTMASEWAGAAVFSPVFLEQALLVEVEYGQACSGKFVKVLHGASAGDGDCVCLKASVAGTGTGPGTGTGTGTGAEKAGQGVKRARDVIAGRLSQHDGYERMGGGKATTNNAGG